MKPQGSTLNTFGWVGTIAGLGAFFWLHEEMAALLFWIGLGMLIHASSRYKDLPLWEVFVEATHRFRLALLLLTVGALIFFTAHTLEGWYVHDLFEPLGALVSLLAVAMFLAGARISATKR